MTHKLVKYNKGQYISDDCGCFYHINKVGHKYYHMTCVYGNGVNGLHYINDVDTEFIEAMKIGKDKYITFN